MLSHSRALLFYSATSIFPQTSRAQHRNNFLHEYQNSSSKQNHIEWMQVLDEGLSEPPLTNTHSSWGGSENLALNTQQNRVLFLYSKCLQEHHGKHTTCALNGRATRTPNTLPSDQVKTGCAQPKSFLAVACFCFSCSERTIILWVQCNGMHFEIWFWVSSTLEMI